MGAVFDERNYILASVIKKSVLSENKLLLLNASYWSNYSSLKKSFNLPGRIDFGFSVVFSNGDKIESKKAVPVGLDVFSSNEGVEILRTNGKIDVANMVVQVW